MIRFLDKQKELGSLELLFDLLYENMRSIAPSRLPYEIEKTQFLAEVKPAMGKKPRQIVLMLDGAQIVGYLQYYINGGVFMVEELQIRNGYRATTLFVALWRFMERQIPRDTQWIEAYADRRNVASQCLIRKLGLVPDEKAGDGPLVHFRGEMTNLFSLQKK